MANNVFDIKDDFKIEFQTPTANNWIWGVSVWDGGNVWGGVSSSIEWRDLHCEIASLDVERGCETDMGVIVAAPVQRAKIVLNTSTYDPFSNGTIRAGTPVKISFRTEPDTNPSAYNTMFTGTVEAFSTAYDANGNSIVTLSCVDALQSLFNTRVASLVVAASTTPFALLSSLFSTYGSITVTQWGAAADFCNMAAITYTDTTVGDIIRDCLIVGQGAVWSSGNGSVYYISAADMNYMINTSYTFDFSTIHSTDTYHVCMSDLVMAADSRQLPTEIIATLTTGAKMTLRNSDAYQLYGAISYLADVSIDNATAGQLWLDNLNLTTRLRRVQSLTFPALRRNGTIFDWHAFQDGLFFDAQLVTYDLGGTNFSEKYFATKQIDNVRPDGWHTTLELWRGI
jgi:hypothetical protein